MNDFPLNEAKRVITTALNEDVGLGDITTLSVVPEGSDATAVLMAKEPLRVAGTEAFCMTFELLDPNAELEWMIYHMDGEDVQKGDAILTVKGDARLLLTGERTALNIMQRLSAIATMTADWAVALEGTKTKLIDTRKTTPGLRALEKYAVRVGGGKNHRVGLFDGILIKENHIRAAGSIKEAVAAARANAPHTLRVEVEVTDLRELEEAIDAGADAVLLDNMTNTTMKLAVKINKGRVILEASGNVRKDRLAEIAACGVDLISAGALTHSAPAVDLSLLFED
jgi:nicotinate-nucleotide pyrophosphorylase (carboxylating)